MNTEYDMKNLYMGAFTYGVRFLGGQLGQAASDFTKQAYVVKYLIRVGRSKIPLKHHMLMIPYQDYQQFQIFLFPNLQKSFKLFLNGLGTN